MRNAGTLTAGGGTIALRGPRITNDGTLNAKGGAVALAAGNTITRDLDGDKLIGLSVDQGALYAVVENHGVISVDGGQVQLTARAAQIS